MHCTGFKSKIKKSKNIFLCNSPLWNQLLGGQELCYPIISISISSFIHQVTFECVTQPQQKFVDSWLKLYYTLIIFMKTGGRGEDKLPTDEKAENIIRCQRIRMGGGSISDLTSLILPLTE